MKQCATCGSTKADDQFYAKHRSCKRCANDRITENGKKRRLAGRLPRQTRSGKASEVRRQRRYRAKNQDKVRARSAVGTAVRSGKLTKPTHCEICGENPGTASDGRSLLWADHHKGYAPEHWLDVRWICVSCDGKQRRKHH